jgi:hypothetical protein
MKEKEKKKSTHKLMCYSKELEEMAHSRSEFVFTIQIPL